jgi:autotransporter-associated beta strand protein
LVFGDIDASSAASWILTNNSVAGNILTLSGTTPSITVNALGSSKTVSISAALAGTSGLTKAGAGTLTLAGANTYSGATIVSNGILQISGQPYFHVGRTTTVASGAVLELSNSNNTFATLMPTSSIAGAGTFRLTGNTTINQDLLGVSGNRLTFAMDAGALIDLQDSARLTNGGWQQMNWSNNFAGMNIASGATLDVWDGQDVIIDALTGAGTVDKLHGGNSPRLLKVGIANGSGTFSGTIKNTGGQITFSKDGIGTQTLSGVNTYTGNTTVANGGLIISPSGSLRFRPTTNGQTNSLSGSSLSTLSYLGAVNLDLTAANTTDGNFWTLVNINSFTSTAPILTPATVTSTLGDFTETSEGTWELELSTAKWVFTEADGILAYEVAATDYQLWASSYGLADGSEALDSDHDGLTNFAEYAFGLIPNSGSSVNAIVTPLNKSNGQFSYTRRDLTLPETSIDYSVWYSTDLINWLEDAGAVEGSIISNGDVDTVPVTISSSLLSNPKLFIQVRAN